MYFPTALVQQPLLLMGDAHLAEHKIKLRIKTVQYCIFEGAGWWLNRSN